MKLTIYGIAAAVALAFAGTAQAQAPSTSPDKPRIGARADGTDKPAKPAERKVKNAEEERIEADAKMAKAKCDAMKGNAKDICQAEAKGKEKVAKAELDAKSKPTPRNQRKVEDAKADAEYAVAKERCDDQKGDAKNACQKEAKAKHDRARADIKVKHAQADKRAATGGTAERTKPAK